MFKRIMFNTKRIIFKLISQSSVLGIGFQLNESSTRSFLTHIYFVSKTFQNCKLSLKSFLQRFEEGWNFSTHSNVKMLCLVAFVSLIFFSDFSSFRRFSSCHVENIENPVLLRDTIHFTAHVLVKISRMFESFEKFGNVSKRFSFFK